MKRQTNEWYEAQNSGGVPDSRGSILVQMDQGFRL